MLIYRPENIQEVLVSATRALGLKMPYREARLQAELLLAHTLGTTRTMVLARLTETISPDLAARYAASVARRAQQEPLGYILGHQEFYGLDFLVDRRVLIPRHETELLVQLALERVHHIPHAVPIIMDVGTGSGVLALTLAHRLPNAQVLATDISPDALAVAQMNAVHLNLAGRVQFIQGDLLEPITERFDILIANLPYIPAERYQDLPVEVRRYEPRIALEGGEDGFAVVRRLLAELPAHAGQGALALLEISEEQGAEAIRLAKTIIPRASVKLHQDLEGLDRALEIQIDRPYV
jgi:release factor glutamine methyltransferase